MVDAKHDVKPDARSEPRNGDAKSAAKSKPVNPRDAIREQRQRRLKLVSSGMAKTVKVFAGNENMRAVLRHSNGTRFRSTLDEAVEWPADSFTSRRIADGSVRTDGPGPAEQAEADDSLNPRQQAAVRKGVHAVASKFKLSSLSPNTAVAGATADIVMSCIGTGFTPDTVIKFGTYDEPTTFVSPTEVTTGVKPSLFVNPDTVPVLVHSGGDSSKPLDFTFTAPAAQTKAASHSPPKHAAT